jgi:Arc/MetJ family transcription regulator
MAVQNMRNIEIDDRLMAAAHLQGALGKDEILVGDLMLCEVLRGLDGDRTARQVEG